MGRSKDCFGVDEGTANDLLRKLRATRRSIEDCRDELEVIKNNVSQIYAGKGAEAYAATTTTLNKAVTGILEKFEYIENILEKFTEETVDNDNTNSSNMSLM